MQIAFPAAQQFVFYGKLLFNDVTVEVDVGTSPAIFNLAGRYA